MGIDKIKKILKTIVVGIYQTLCVLLFAAVATALFFVQLLACCSFGSGNVLYILFGSVWLGSEFFFMYYCYKKDKEENKNEESILNKFK